MVLGGRGAGPLELHNYYIHACEKLHTPEWPPPNVLGGQGVARTLRVGYEAVGRGGSGLEEYL